MEFIKEIDKVINQNADLLNLLRFNADIDRAEISRRLQVSMPTVYKAIDDACKAGVINKGGEGISLCSDFSYLVGISIGSGLCKISFLDFGFNLLSPDEFRAYKIDLGNEIKKCLCNQELILECLGDDARNYIYFKTPENFAELKKIIDCILTYIMEKNCSGKLKVCSVGISCTGIINNETQTIVESHNLEYLDNTTLDTLIFPDKKKYFDENGIYICLLQNSDASIIAEKIYLYLVNSPYKKKKNIISLYLGVGIGAGIYLDGLYSGTSGYAGEVGHIKAPDFEKEFNFANQCELIDKSCTCGNKDCYDYKIRSYVFGMPKDIFAQLSSNKIKDFLSDECNLKRTELLGKYMGNMINTSTNILNIDLIIFTGKFYKTMDSLYNSIVSVQDQNQLKFSRNDCTLLTSVYGSLAPSVGAALYAYHKKYNIELRWDYD